MKGKRIEFTPSVEAQIVELMTRGGTAESISRTLTASGILGASRATIGRRMSELRGRLVAARMERRAAGQSVRPGEIAPPSPEPAETIPTSLEEIPVGTDLQTFDRWLERAERMAEDAEAEGNLKDLGAAGRLVSMLLEAKRKATPIPKPDPNDDPDRQAEAALVAERFHKLIDQVLKP